MGLTCCPRLILNHLICSHVTHPHTHTHTINLPHQHTLVLPQTGLVCACQSLSAKLAHTSDGTNHVSSFSVTLSLFLSVSHSPPSPSRSSSHYFPFFFLPIIPIFFHPPFLSLSLSLLLYLPLSLWCNWWLAGQFDLPNKDIFKVKSLCVSPSLSLSRGFSVTSAEHTKIFKPVSIQTMW